MKIFYKEVMGMKEVVCGEEKSSYIATILGLPTGRVLVCKLTFPEGGMIELLYTDEDQHPIETEAVWRIGRHHIAITVDHVEAEYKRLKDLGVEFISMPCISPDLFAKVCFCRDPEGNYMELVEELKR